MNERIKELVIQADNYAYKMNPEEDSYGRPANPRKFQQDRDKKFAELIVKECVATIANDTANYQGEGMMAYYQGVQDSGKSIKQHFGVD